MQNCIDRRSEMGTRLPDLLENCPNQPSRPPPTQKSSTATATATTTTTATNTDTDISSTHTRLRNTTLSTAALFHSHFGSSGLLLLSFLEYLLLARPLLDTRTQSCMRLNLQARKKHLPPSICQRGAPIDPLSIRGPIRLRLSKV